MLKGTEGGFGNEGIIGGKQGERSRRRVVCTSRCKSSGFCLVVNA